MKAVFARALIGGAAVALAFAVGHSAQPVRGLPAAVPAAAVAAAAPACTVHPAPSMPPGFTPMPRGRLVAV